MKVKLAGKTYVLDKYEIKRYKSLCDENGDLYDGMEGFFLMWLSGNNNLTYNLEEEQPLPNGRKRNNDIAKLLGMK